MTTRISEEGPTSSAAPSHSDGISPNERCTCDPVKRRPCRPHGTRNKAAVNNELLKLGPAEGTSIEVQKTRSLEEDGTVGKHYTPSTSWLINKGFDRNRKAALWKCYVQPGTIILADVDHIFFWMPRLQPTRYIEARVLKVLILVYRY
ncbi:hypothetical protein R1sor_027534 [Riccia sorocarpa]|uniref:Uncharacterized protein n=1 Tax=Riccia sorocarpa TaxID=122646 RepID=A0ABD3GFY3_9MARC